MELANCSVGKRPPSGLRRLLAKAYGLLALLLLALPAPAQVLLADDFNDGDAAGWTEFDGSFSVQNGEYVIETSGFCNEGRAVSGSPAWTDYRIDVDFFVDSVEPNAHAAVLFRAEEVGSGCSVGRYYQAHVFPDHVGFCRINYSGAACTILAVSSLSTPLQQWHHLTVHVQGATATISVDGTEALSFSGFVEYPAGRIGVKSVNTQTVRYDNVLVLGPESWTWADLGGSLPSATGDPALSGTGLLLPSTPLFLSLTNAATFAPTVLVTGLSAIAAPFKGGVMVPHPGLLLFATTDGFGALNFGAPWPAGVPSGLDIYMQFWVTDEFGPQGFTASNAVKASTP